MDLHLRSLICLVFLHLDALHAAVHVAAGRGDLDKGSKLLLEDEETTPKVETVSQTQSTQTLSTSTPYFTFPYDSLDLQCKVVATDFSYRNNLCHASDPESYVKSNKQLYSCVNRCGQAMTGTLNHFQACSCDKRCIVHEDCCRDMPLVCQDTYQEGRKFYGHLAETSGTLCHYGFKQLTKCHRSVAIIESARSAILSPNGVTSMYEKSEEFSLPFPTRSLKQLSASFELFTVADLVLGVVFKNPAIFNICSLSKSLPYLVPKTVRLKCWAKVHEDISSAVDILKWCRKVSTTTAITPFHRNCQREKLITCHCNTNQTHVDFVHNACSGYDSSVPRLSRYPVWKYHKEVAFKASSNDAPCEINYSGKTRQDTSHTGRSQSEQGIPSETIMSISPVPKAYTHKEGGHLNRNSRTSTHIPERSSASPPNRSANDIMRSTNSYLTEYGDSHHALKARAQVGYQVEHQSTSFVVELRDTIERRFLCSSLRQRLSQCQLLDCA